MTESSLVRLLNIMAMLRDGDKGCPWDLQQTHDSLLPYMIEEAYEVIEAVERHDKTALLDELGDVLFQVVFHARLAEEEGEFDFDDVVQAISVKLLRRHPHVFADQPMPSADQQRAHWEELKAEERQLKHESIAEGTQGALAGVAAALPALIRSIKLQQRAARVGFDWNDARQVLAKVAEELDEVEQELGVPGREAFLEHEIGDLLMAVTNLARHVAVDPEIALRHANRRFEQRFSLMESFAARDQRALADLSSAEWEQYWLRAKRESC